MDITHTIRIDEDDLSLNMIHFWISTSYNAIIIDEFLD